jgi:hypothetical protein
MTGPWAPPRLVGHALWRSERTIRTWMAQGVVRSQVIDGRLCVHLPDALRESEQRPRRFRLTA